MKIYDWKKFGTFLAIVLFLVIVALHCCRKQEPKVEHIEEHNVECGETIWSIASDHKPNAMSIQEYVYYIRELNNEDDCIINIGQKLQIPIFEEV